MKIRLAALCAVGVTLFAGGLAAPASAAEPVIVNVLVTDSSGQPVENATVTLEHKTKKSQMLGYTLADGTLSTSEDYIGEPITSGAWTLAVTDYDDDRLESGDAFVASRRPVTLAVGANTLSASLLRGAKIHGRITAPSGRPVTNIPVQAWMRSSTGTFAWDFHSGQFTADDGTFRDAGFAAGTYRLRAGTYPNYNETPGKPTNVPDFTLAAEQDRTDPLLITNWKVTCTTANFAASSSVAGQIRLRVQATSPQAGLTNPYGKVVIKRGTTTVKTVTVNGTSQLFIVGGQPKGKATKYTATYTGGDCLSWTTSKTVTIKK